MCEESRGNAEDLESFPDASMRENVADAAQDTQLDLAKFESSLQYVNTNYDIPYYWSFGPSGIKTLLKRVVRKILKCLIPPILEKQNCFNEHVVSCMNAIRDLFTRADAQAEEIALLKRELFACREETERRIAVLREEFGKEVERRIAVLQEECGKEAERRIASLREECGEETEKQIKIKYNEIYSMIALNEGSIGELKEDMDCIRRVDASIFSSYKNQENYHKYAQSGEDSIIAYIFKSVGIRPENVSYLDLGANHARELSNTYYFYRSGASGVLVEANPNLIPELRLLRSRDVILNNCVSSADNNLVDFYIMSGDGLSTESKASVDEISSINPQMEVVETVRIKTISVHTILDQYFLYAPTLLNIDLEGSEMDVLTSFDFEKYRPFVIIVETIPYRPHLVIGEKNDQVASYLKGKGYAEYAFTGINSIFIDTEKFKGGSYGNDRADDMDFTQNMFTNELASGSSYGICLKPGGMVYGPYTVCAAGEYRLEVKTAIFDSTCPTYLNITAEAGTEQIKQFSLLNGMNRLRFSLEAETKGVEFVIRNQTNDNMYLLMVKLQRER